MISRYELGVQTFGSDNGVHHHTTLYKRTGAIQPSAAIPPHYRDQWLVEYVPRESFKLRQECLATSHGLGRRTYNLMSRLALIFGDNLHYALSGKMKTSSNHL